MSRVHIGEIEQNKCKNKLKICEKNIFRLYTPNEYKNATIPLGQPDNEITVGRY